MIELPARLCQLHFPVLVQRDAKTAVLWSPSDSVSFRIVRPRQFNGSWTSIDRPCGGRSNRITSPALHGRSQSLVQHTMRHLVSGLSGTLITSRLAILLFASDRWPQGITKFFLRLDPSNWHEL
ncbi:hypothetical protein MPLB_1500015 [Mesorhizobium sp. ORS 3324]|nr:hypothetical protein MPLB_1500015 [Mesorhizobium sp. ORS 3324]